MSEVFEIAPERNTWPLAGSAIGRMSFSIRNLTGRRIKSRCELTYAGGFPPPAKEWFSIAGVREFAIEPQSAVTIQVVFDGGAASGPIKGDIQLLCYAVDDPEETSELSEPVDFEFRPIEVKPIPWLYLALGGGAVAALLLLIVFLNSGADPSPSGNPAPGPRPFPGGTLRVECNGAYIAIFEATWQESDGRFGSDTSKNLHVGERDSIEIPRGASNIVLSARVVPTNRSIFQQRDPDLSRRFIVVGVVTNPRLRIE